MLRLHSSLGFTVLAAIEKKVFFFFLLTLFSWLQENVWLGCLTTCMYQYT